MTSLKGLKLKAYRVRYDFHKMTVKNNIVYGHYKLSNGFSKTELGHLDDIWVTVMKNGNRVVSNRGHHIHTFGPVK
jgi:hypothetical protein